MSRLTKRHSDGTVGISQFRYYNYDDFQKLARKLAEYEDLEEQGLLLKLPCKIGDTLWTVCQKLSDKNYYIEETYITDFEVHKSDIVFWCNNGLSYYDKEIAKYVFLTKEEGEKELKRLEGAE